MKRVLMQIYVKNRTEAFEFYQKAFNAELGFGDKDENGNIIHAELNIYGQYLAVGEYYHEPKEILIGNTMQFCLQFDKGEGRNQKMHGLSKENRDLSYMVFFLIAKITVFMLIIGEIHVAGSVCRKHAA